MENIKAEGVLNLLDNMELISEVSVFGTKVISDRIVQGRLVIRDKNLNQTITFKNCSFEDVYIDTTQSSGSVEFRNCTFSKDFMILFLKAEDFTMQNCHLEKSFIITNCRLRCLLLDRIEAQNGISVEAGNIHISEIKPVNEKTYYSLIGAFLFVRELYIVSQSGITLTCKKTIINKLSLTGYFNTASRLDFNSIINKQIDINEINNDGKIYLLDIRPEYRGYNQKYKST